MTGLIVQKYGGTSVGTTERIKNVAQRIAEVQRTGKDVMVVVSAMAGETDKLLAMARTGGKARAIARMSTTPSAPQAMR